MNDAAAAASLRRRLAWLAASGGAFFLVYGLCGALTAQRADVGTWYHPLELRIPFLPWTIVPYWSIDLLFVAAFFLVPDRASLDCLGKRVLMAIVLAGCGFVLLPLELAFPRPEVGGLPGLLFELLHAFDGPHNLFPSLHVALSLILADVYRRDAAGRLARALVVAWFLVVVASTLFTWQHHVVDVAGGAVLGALCLYVFRPVAARQPVVPQPRIGALYVLAALASALLAWVAWPWGAVLLWPALACGIVAAAYFGLGPGVYRKEHGRIAASARWILAPCLLGQRLSLAWYRRRSTAWSQITPLVWIGRVLGPREAVSALAAGVRSVLDLTAELDEAAPLRRADGYRHLPILDLTPPTPSQLDEAVAFVRGGVAKGGAVFVHCKIGWSRSAAVAGAWLLASGAAATAEEAIDLLRRARPGLVVRWEVHRALAVFAAARGDRLSDLAGSRV